MKPVQYFDPDYLRRCRKMTPEQIVQFLDDFRRIHGHPIKKPARSRLISLKVPEDLLRAFRQKADLHEVRYQTQIKRLMTDWLARPLDDEHV